MIQYNVEMRCFDLFLPNANKQMKKVDKNE